VELGSRWALGRRALPPRPAVRCLIPAESGSVNWLPGSGSTARRRGRWCPGGRCGGRAPVRAPRGLEPRETVSRFGHSGALMALNRHFRRHFARFVMGISAISEAGYRRMRMSLARVRRGWGGTRRWRSRSCREAYAFRYLPPDGISSAIAATTNAYEIKNQVIRNGPWHLFPIYAAVSRRNFPRADGTVLATQR
jgi:hypothetical protein